MLFLRGWNFFCLKKVGFGFAISIVLDTALNVCISSCLKNTSEFELDARILTAKCHGTKAYLKSWCSGRIWNTISYNFFFSVFSVRICFYRFRWRTDSSSCFTSRIQSCGTFRMFSAHKFSTGSGDGRIVLAAAQAGFKAVGVELNPWLVFYSRREQFCLLFS